MFTGIIEEKGTLIKKDIAGVSGSLMIHATLVLQGTKVGDSIAVNGVCLTVTSMGDEFFTADVMAETLRRSSLGSVPVGGHVNLERAMAAGGRFGGHIVSGHIDGTGIVTSMTGEGNATIVRIAAGKEILDLVVEKGSVTIDGISLTVASVSREDFTVSVIPHTGDVTTLMERRAGDLVNLENDMVGKYVQKLLGLSKGAKEEKTQEITLEMLESLA